MTSCGVLEPPEVITISNRNSFRPSDPTEIQSVEKAFAAILTICQKDLGLPIIEPIYVKLYKNTTSFAFYGRGWSTLSFDVADLVAFADQNIIHVNLAAVGKLSWAELIPVLAHEYAHIIEHSIATGSPQIKTWFAEGFAEWVGFKVVHFLGWRDYDASLHASSQELSRFRQFVPNLSALNTVQHWKALTEKPKGWIQTYGLAFVAVDRLIHDNTLSGALNYLRNGQFQTNFRRTADDYAAQLYQQLDDAKRSNDNTLTAVKPRWQIDDHWIYVKKEAGKTERVVMQVIKEDTRGGVQGFVVAENSKELFYSKEELALVATSKNNVLETMRRPPNAIFVWPLEPGKQFRTEFALEVIKDNKTVYIDRTTFISGLETVRVEAGTFKTIKLEKYDTETGRLRLEYWYAPEVNWYVKSRFYGKTYLTELELVSFRIT